MHRDLIDALRCPAPHAETWLVAMVHTARASDLIRADLSCPVCGAEYPIVDGVAYFTSSEPVPTASESTQPPPDAAEGLRMAALLGVAAGLVPVGLVGQRALLGPALAGLVPVPQVHINPTYAPAADSPVADEPHSVLRVAARLPLGVGTLAAIAIDDAHAVPAFLESAVRTLRAGGRLVAPAATPVPSGLTELARDDRDWVAEAVAQASGLVELRRRDPDAVR